LSFAEGFEEFTDEGSLALRVAEGELGFGRKVT
jgi:hypothetical protein